MTKQEILSCFRKMTDEIASRRIEFAKIPEANDLVYENLFAFCLAACLDRRARSDLVWIVPNFLQKRWGHLEPGKIAEMDAQDVTQALEESPCGWQLRMSDVANTVISFARLVHEDCSGDTARLFEGSVRQILRRFMTIRGVGPGIANMLLIQRIRFFGLRPDGLDELDVKADTHIIRVFCRVGLSDAETEAAALLASAFLAPEDRIAADQACWHIGRDHCHKSHASCMSCPVELYCPKVNVPSA